MALYCSECHYGVQNPFYSMRLVIRGNNKLAFSEIEYAICRVDIERMPARDEIGTLFLAYAIDQVTGSMGGPSDLLVVDFASREEKHKFIRKETALSILPKTAGKLLEKPLWVEKIGNEWKPADWAYKLYK